MKCTHSKLQYGRLAALQTTSKCACSPADRPVDGDRRRDDLCFHKDKEIMQKIAEKKNKIREDR